MTILITGCAGFIGYHVSSQLLNKFKKSNLVGIDNLDPFYDLNLKINRLKKLKQHKKRFIFVKANLSSKKKINKIFNDIYKMSHKNWIKNCYPISKRIISYDNGNKTFLKKVNNVF